MRSIVVVNGHPDPRPERFCAALAGSYARGAAAGGWRAGVVKVGDLSLSALDAMAAGEPTDAQAEAMLAEIERADRLVIVFPLWFDKPPQPLCTLFSRIAPRKAHVAVTMDMPAFAYRSMLRTPAASAMLEIPGIAAEEPVLIGCVSTIGPDQRRAWLRTMHDYGERATFGSAVEPSCVQSFAAMIDRTVAQLLA